MPSRAIFLEGKFTTLNQYIRAERGHLYKAAEIKKTETARVKYSCIGILPVENYPVSIQFIWSRHNHRTDPDNIAFAKKFILDGLVEAGVLAGDSFKQISGFSDTFTLEADGVNVIIYEPN